MAHEKSTERTLYEAMARLYDTKEGSDVTIKVGNVEFKAHKIVVCSRSEYFRNCFEGKFAEAQSGVLYLPEESPEIFQYCLQYLYLEDYEAPPDCDPLLHGNVYIAGDMYLLPGLSNLAKEGYIGRLNYVIHHGDIPPLHKLATELYDTQCPYPEIFRKEFINRLYDRFSWVLNRGEFLEMIRNMPQLAVDLTQDLPQRLTPRAPARFCLTCNREQDFGHIRVCVECNGTAYSDDIGRINDSGWDT